ncbi:MAG: hypothetical protein CM15mP59_0940 [Flavobacteriaceae bacterium]|nr:MAG: hypothetical protein CM15mP59_0940 [Flavobacteriaceae bacterium]
MYKRVLGGYLLHIQQEVFRLLRTIVEEGVLDERFIFWINIFTCIYKKMI